MIGPRGGRGDGNQAATTQLYTSASDVLRGASQEMLHRTVRATLKQWRTRIDRAQRQQLDLAPVAVALMLDAGDTEGARRIRLIAEGLQRAERPVTVSVSEDAAATVDAVQAPAEPQDGPPTQPPEPEPPAPLRSTRRKRTQRASKRAQILHLQPEPAEDRIRAALAAEPGLSVRALAREAGVSESTASKYRRLVLAEAQRAATH